VQSVERPNAQAGTVAASELGAKVEGRFRQRHFHPQTAIPVLLKALMQKVGFRARHYFPEDLLFDGMSPLGHMKRSQPHGRTVSHPSLGLGRMPIGNIERNEEAGVRVDVQ